MLDYIFLYLPSHQQAKVEDYSVLTDTGDIPLSDHRPVVCDAILINHMQEGEETLKFSIKFDTNPGENIYVVGSIPDLGNWNLNKAPRMKWNPGNLWTLELRLKQVNVTKFLGIIE